LPQTNGFFSTHPFWTEDHKGREVPHALSSRSLRSSVRNRRRPNLAQLQHVLIK
jgi:hypothetical protein